jgi:hypothetical protein
MTVVMTTANIVREVLTLSVSTPSSVTLLTSALRVLDRDDAAFASIRRNALRSSVTARQDYVAVLRAMFSDGIVNWERIVVMFALAIDVQRYHKIDLQAETVLIIEDNLHDEWWLGEQRRLDGFVDSTSLQIAFLLLFVAIAGGFCTTAVAYLWK